MKSILILFATQTGTAEELAKEMIDSLTTHHLTTHCSDIYDCDINILKKHSICLIIASTWGDGDPPDDAEEFYENLNSNKIFDLSSLQFAVFGLGDSAYEEFNACGKGFDRMLAERGAERILPRVDCDIDIDGPFEQWTQDILNIVKPEKKTQLS